MAVQTPNMFLYQPVIAVDSGLTWEQNVNTNSAIIDGHNHSIGSGVQINPSGINLNADLPFNNNNAISLRSSRYLSQPSPIALASDLLCSYFSGVDFYVNDGNGNQIQITSGGTVNATSSGISNGTASASFVSSVLVVDSAPNAPANIQAASFLMGNTGIVGSFYLTLSPPSSLVANYSLVLPSLPPQTNVMILDTSGNMGSITYDQVGQNMTVVGADSIASNIDSTGADDIGSVMTSAGASALATQIDTTGANSIGSVMGSAGADPIGLAMTATGANNVNNVRTRPTGGATEGIGGIASTPGCGTFTSTSTGSPGTAISNLDIFLTNSSRPISINIIPSGVSGGSALSTTAGNFGQLVLQRNGVSVAYWNFATNGSTVTQSGSFTWIDVGISGTSSAYNYIAYLRSNSGAVVTFSNYLMVGYEL